MIEIVELSEIVSKVKSFYFFIITKWKTVFVILILSLTASYFYWKNISDNYTAKATFIVEEAGSKGGGLSGIASQFGFDVGSLLGGSSSGLFSGENIFEIINSRLIIEKVLLTKVSDNSKLTLADLYLDINNYRKKNQIFEKVYFYNIKQNHTVQEDSILFVIYKDILKNNLIVEKQNKKSSLITIQVSSSNQEFSKLFSERILSQTSELYISIKTKNLSKTIEKIQLKADSLQNSLNFLSNKSYNVSKANQIINTNTSYKINTTQEEVTTRDKTVTYTLYAEVVKNLETLKLTLINQTPAIQILDLPKYPLINQKINLFIVIIFGLFAGLFGSILLLLYKYINKKEI